MRGEGFTNDSKTATTSPALAERAISPFRLLAAIVLWILGGIVGLIVFIVCQSV